MADADAIRLASSMVWKRPFIHEPSYCLSLATENAAFRHLSSNDLSSLLPDSEALEMLGRPDLLPAREGGGKYFHPTQVTKARTRDMNQPIVAAMATYGHQHKPPLRLLKRIGLNTH